MLDEFNAHGASLRRLFRLRVTRAALVMVTCVAMIVSLVAITSSAYGSGKRSRETPATTGNPLIAGQNSFSNDDLVSLARFYAGVMGSTGTLTIGSVSLPASAAMALLSAPGGGPPIQNVTGGPDPNQMLFVAHLTGTFAGTTNNPAIGQEQAPVGASSILLIIDPTTGMVVGSRSAASGTAALPDLAAAAAAAGGNAAVTTEATTPLQDMPSAVQQVIANNQADLQNPQAGPVIGPPGS